MPPWNCSHFKPKWSGKPDEDTKSHLLRTNDWMDTHGFPDHFKVHRLCLTLIGEARLWYESLRLINADWIGLQNNFRQQYSKIGNTREQLFHAWTLFHFVENAEMIDAYVNHGRQVTTHLGYQDLQILEVFKNTLLKKIIVGSFSNNGLETSSRKGRQNSKKRKDRKAISKTDFHDSIHEYKRRFWQKRLHLTWQTA